VEQTSQSAEARRANASGGGNLFFPVLEPFYERAKPLAYALLRATFGLTIVTHGVPKIMGSSHGSMADPMAGSMNLIENVIGLPLAPQLATFVALLETFGGLAVAIGLGTRLFAPMLAIQMLFISYALWPTNPWIDRGIEYPIILGVVALHISIAGGGTYSLDARMRRQL
jgi:putative oxidoreductase